MLNLNETPSNVAWERIEEMEINKIDGVQLVILEQIKNRVYWYSLCNGILGVMSLHYKEDLPLGKKSHANWRAALQRKNCIFQKIQQ